MIYEKFQKELTKNCNIAEGSRANLIEMLLPLMKNYTQASGLVITARSNQKDQNVNFAASYLFYTQSRAIVYSLCSLISSRDKDSLEIREIKICLSLIEQLDVEVQKRIKDVA